MLTLRVDDDIHLRLYERQHAQTLFDLGDSSREHISAWLPWIDSTLSAQDSLNYIRSARRALAERGEYQAGMFYKGKLAGGIGLHPRGGAHAKAEIGYWLGEDFTGQGIVTRAVRALTDCAFNELGLNRLFIRCATGNVKSCAVPERLGFMREGVLRQDVWMRDRYVDMVIYAMLADDWTPHDPDARFARRLDDEIELRLLEARHAEELFVLTHANREHLRQWLPWLDDTQTVDDTLNFIRGGLDQYRREDGLQLGIWVEDDLAGVAGYHYWDFHHRKTEIGYWLGQAYSGRGIMSRAVEAMLRYAFVDLGLNRVEIPCATGNAKSCAIPQRLGFRHEGVVRQAEWLYDHYVDWNLYALLADDWRESRRET